MGSGGPRRSPSGALNRNHTGGTKPSSAVTTKPFVKMWETKFNNRLSLIGKENKNCSSFQGLLKIRRNDWSVPREPQLRAPSSASALHSVVPPRPTSGTGSQSVGTKVSQAEHQLFGQASHVTHCCRMCFQSSGYRFRRWLHIDGSCCPVWKDHKVLWSQRRRVTVGSEPEWLIIGPFSSFPDIPGCCPSPKAAPRSSPAFPRPVAVAVELSSAHQPGLHMNPAEVSWCVCVWPLSSAAGELIVQMQQARLSCAINQRDDSLPPYSRDL